MSNPYTRTAHRDILIAGGSRPTREGLHSLLERSGRRCAAVGSGREAITLALGDPPQCLLLDLSLPEMDGLAVARRLRSDPRTRATHIHALADPRAPSARAEATGAGIELYLTPRADPGAVAALLRRQAERPEIGALSYWSLTEAEELLDWLEVNGCTDLGMSWEDDGGVTVHCLCPDGYRLVRDARGAVCLLRA